MRKVLKSEEVFYKNLISLIKNQLINDPNFKGDFHSPSWYEKNNKLHYSLFLEKAEYILEEIEKTKHLILQEDEQTKM